MILIIWELQDGQINKQHTLQISLLAQQCLTSKWTISSRFPKKISYMMPIQYFGWYERWGT